MEKFDCINCGEQKELDQLTPYFSGLVSLMLPNSSWVAKWNDLEGKKPGIYALKIIEDTAEY